jgi:hypothetical protein
MQSGCRRDQQRVFGRSSSLQSGDPIGPPRRLDAAALEPGQGWPDLHENYPEVLQKLRATHSADGDKGSTR